MNANDKIKLYSPFFVGKSPVQRLPQRTIVQARIKSKYTSRLHIPATEIPPAVFTLVQTLYTATTGSTPGAWTLFSLHNIHPHCSFFLFKLKISKSACSYSIPTLFYCESFLQMLYSAFQLSSWKAPRAKSLIHFSPNRFNIARKINVSPPGFELPEFADSYVILMSNVKSKIKRDYSYQKFQTSSIEHGFNVKQYDWIVPTSLLQ